MAIFHARMQVIGRSTGRSAVAAAAYRAAERLHDARQQRDHDFTGKTGVVHSEIMLPSGAPERWRDRATLWNEVEATEKRKDAQLAREMEFSIPREMPRAEAIRLARDFVAEQFVSRGMVADVAVHWATAGDGEAQPHAHVMLTMRETRPDGFGPKARAWNSRALYEGVRERWAALANERLAEQGHDVRIDHRSYAEQGIGLEPQHKIGPAGARRAARGEAAERAAAHRAIARRNGERIAADPALALDALTRQHSTFTRADLARLVNRHADGAAQFAQVMARVEASPALVRLGADGRGRLRFTTRDMLRVEQGLERDAAALAGRATHGAPLAVRRALMANSGLGAEQATAFGHVTRARDLVAVVGYAGTGKSTMLGVAREAWAAAGYRVRGAAVSGIAAEGLQGGSGIESRTLASLEWAWGEGRDALTAGDVLVVDEAGMVGSRQMARVLSHARAGGAKVVLVGDPEQLQAIEAGAAFRAVAERHGAAAITEVRRQRVAWQREATRELATGRTAAALGRYEAAGMVRGHGTEMEARAALVEGWDQARRAQPGASQVMLAGTNADVEALNRLARARLRAAGGLGVERLVSTERGVRALAAGDRVMFRRNERALGADGHGRGGVAVRNGSLGTVLAVADGGERLTVRLDRGAGGAGADAASAVAFSVRDYGHLDWGYAATVHKAQGVTADRAHVLAGAFTDRHATYVALSRHRDGAVLHWSAEAMGDRAGLDRMLGRERAKDTSLDYGAGDDELAPAAAERAAAAYAERRGVAPAADALANADTAGQRAAARIAVLLNRVGALQEAGAATADRYADQVAARRAAGSGMPDLQARLRQARAVRALDGLLDVAARAVAQGTATLERVAAAVAGLSERRRAAAERAQAAAEAAKAQRRLREEAAAGVSGWREEYAAETRRRAADAARDAQARGLVAQWGALIAAYNEALPGLDRDPRHEQARAALVGFAGTLGRHPDAVAALRARPEAFGMADRPTLARVLGARDPARAAAGYLDGCEAERRHADQAREARAAVERAAQEAARQAREAARPRQSFGPSM